MISRFFLLSSPSMSFVTLPRELQVRILLYVTQPPHGSIGQAPALALVSRVAYSIITELLFKHIRVTNVTTLRRIHAGLEANPALGALVQSIHIGPDEALPFRGWPLRTDQPTTVDDRPAPYLETTLPETQLPRWVKPGSIFSIDFAEERTCQHYAVERAIRAALLGLNVNPRKRGWSQTPHARRIGVRAWALRLWEAQAALDLYLMEMRKREEEGDYDVEHWSLQGSASSHPSDVPIGCVLGKCEHYPILEIKNRSKSASPLAAKHLYLSKADLWHHIARQGSRIEHFDHLILFARSRRSDLDMGNWEWHALEYDLGGPHRAWFNEDNVEDGEEDLSIVSSDERYWIAREPAYGSALAKVGKGEELLRLARSVLARLPRVINLSLSSFLFRALDSFQATDSLVSLTLGPIAPWWNHVLLSISSGEEGYEESKYQGWDFFDYRGDAGSDVYSEEGEATMQRLESLRICGKITNQDARKIATQLQSLREMYLEITTEIGSE